MNRGLQGEYLYRFNDALAADCRAKIARMWEYAHLQDHQFEDWMRYYSEMSPFRLNNDKVYAELCWIVYAAGFRNEILRRHWPAITEAYNNFSVEYVANLRFRAKSEAKRICREGTFNNLRKAEWCIHNAQRVLELDNELKDKCGLKGYFLDLSDKSLVELVTLAPSIVKELNFKGIGNTTVFHLLKNTGLNVFKPDIHVRRLLTRMQIIKTENASIDEICNGVIFLCSVTNMRVNELDTLLYYYGQKSNDKIC